MTEQTALDEAQDLEYRVDMVRKLFAPYRRIYKEPEVQRRADTVFFMLCVLKNDFEDLKKEWMKNMERIDTEEISGMFDETIEYIEEIRDAIQPLLRRIEELETQVDTIGDAKFVISSLQVQVEEKNKRIEELEDELVRVCDVLGDEDVALVHKLLGIKNVEDEE